MQISVHLSVHPVDLSPSCMFLCPIPYLCIKTQFSKTFRFTYKSSTLTFLKLNMYVNSGNHPDLLSVPMSHSVDVDSGNHPGLLSVPMSHSVDVDSGNHPGLLSVPMSHSVDVDSGNHPYLLSVPMSHSVDVDW